MAVFLLPPEMIVFFKSHIDFIQLHSTDPDKRRYAVPEEGPRHYLDFDHYGKYPLYNLPQTWNEAVDVYGSDSLNAHGIVPWHIQVMLGRLTASFRNRDPAGILRNSAEIGHYIADAHVPLHTSSNHNGQLTNQQGIHGFWESRIPELLAEDEFDFFIGKAAYLEQPLQYIWQRLLESAAASDTVLSFERKLNAEFPPDRKYAFEQRNGRLVKQYASAYTIKYDRMLQGMVERRMRLSIFSVASYWFTAWVNAGQPDLRSLVPVEWNQDDLKEFDWLDRHWKQDAKMIGREE